MSDTEPLQPRRDAAIALLRQLRRLGETIGVRNSGIALDIALLLYEAGEGGLSVAALSRGSGHSGPTVRLVLTRLEAARAVAPAGRLGKTQLYRLSPRGILGFDAYVGAVIAFADRAARELSPPAAPDPDRDRPAGPPPPRARYAAAPPGRGAAE